MSVYEELADSLRDFYLRMHRLMNDRMKAQGASFAQLKLLIFIERSGHVRSIDISDALGHTPRTVTEAVDGLERDGLVCRTPDPHDRRAKRISVTEAGRAVVRDVDPFKQEFVKSIFDAVSGEDQQHMLRLLELLNVRLTALGAPGPFGDGSRAADKSRQE